MSNQEKIYNYVMENPLGHEFIYSDVSDIANRILHNITGSGRSYAVLKFIQNYCNATLEGESEEIARDGDPRKIINVGKLKQMRFTLRSAVSASQAEQIGKSAPKDKIKSGKASDVECPESYKYDDVACCNKECFRRETQGFRNWLLNALHEFPGFVHGWRARSAMHKSGLVRGGLWNCTSLFSAYQQYVWPALLKEYRKKEWRGRFFEETDTCLDKLKKSLEDAIQKNEGGKCRIRCREIFEWGGVDDRDSVSPHIKTGIPIEQLSVHLSYTRDRLNSLLEDGCDNENNNFIDTNGNLLRVDSGTTKVYSLICKDFVMYDGRVASALGYLVRRWWEAGHLDSESYKSIPQCLRFSYDGNNPHRNPNPGRPGGGRLTIFRRLHVDERRIRENVQASWLLEMLLKEDENREPPQRSSFSYINNFQKRLRALESALFMIGYGLQAMEEG